MVAPVFVPGRALALPGPFLFEIRQRIARRVDRCLALGQLHGHRAFVTTHYFADE